MIKRFALLVSAFFWLTSSVNAQVIDRIVAIVNNDIITLSELNKLTDPYKRKIEASDQTESQKAELFKNVQKDALERLIDQALTRQEAVKYRIRVDKDDVDNAVENFKRMNGLDQASLENALESQGISYENYRDRIRQDILQSMIINRAIRSKVIITAGEIKAYYEANAKMFKGVPKFKLRNILMDDEAAMAKVLDRIRKGESFSDLAKDHSIASNAPEGGTLGIFDIQNFTPSIRDAVKGLQPGQTSKIIGTGQGFQLIHVDDIVMADGKSLEAARDQIHEILYKKQVEEKFKKWIKSLKENAHVKILL